jgi:Fe2+ transport system protein FeoA
VRRAPLGDPLHVRVRSGSFAVRADEARCIHIDGVESR